MEITNKETDKGKDLIYVRSIYNEDYYLSFQSSGVRGWSFMGLRPETEDDLRRYAREIEPDEILGLSSKDIELISPWFDFEKFSDDMEQDWHERHDIQAEREDESGETLYLGFGSGQDIFNYFKENKITNYEKYKEYFEEIGLNKKDFDFINKVIKERKDKDVFKMTDKEQAKEKKIFTDYFTNKK